MNIKKIDTNISEQLNLLKQEVKNIDLEEVCEFELNDESINSIPWNDLAHKGIYLFEIKNDNRFTEFDSWIKDFKEIWETDEYRYKFTPNTRKVRIRAHSTLNKWIPIYIGKSRNVGKRVHEHIYIDLHKTTFALKLMARTNIKHHTFRLKVLKVEVENYDSIIPKIEWQLRNRINPIIGKQ